MKKVIALALAIIMMLSLCACDSNGKEYKEALEALQNGDYEKASELFGKLGEYQDSAQMALESMYQRAVELAEGGAYEEAKEVFESLGDYKDSAQQALENIYQRAIELAEGGAYREAMEALESLDGYKDSAEKIESYREAFRDRQYEDALELIKEGKYKEALESFKELGDYKDSAAKIEECEAAVAEDRYQEALGLMEAGKYTDAAELLKDFDYKDSAEKYEECMSKVRYELTNIGDIITFGKYEQDRNKENGPDPIEWRVLDKQDGKLLIITEKLIDELPYHAIYWKHSPIRGFLNGSFLNDFTPEEKEMIVKTRVEPHKHPEAPDIDQGSAVEEKVFLLSVDEAEKYFAKNEDRVSTLTAYTIWFGDFDQQPGDAYPWWLRTAYWNGSVGAVIAAVNADGIITVYPHSWNCALRPACWIQLES